MKNKLVLFDFDGVIVDTFETSYQFYEKFDVIITRDEYRDRFMGNIHKALREDGYFEGDFDEINDRWFSLYSPAILELPVYPEMDKVIADLAKDYKMVVISSTTSNPIQAFLEKHGLDHFFEKIYGADVHENKTKKVEMTLDEFGAGPEDCVFITDTVGDMKEMNKAGVDSIVVTWGFHETERFEGLEPVSFVNHPSDLLPVVDQYFSKRVLSLER